MLDLIANLSGTLGLDEVCSPVTSTIDGRMNEASGCVPDVPCTIWSIGVGEIPVTSTVLLPFSNSLLLSNLNQP